MNNTVTVEYFVSAFLAWCSFQSDKPLFVFFVGHHDVYRICAESSQERETWIGCVK